MSTPIALDIKMPTSGTIELTVNGKLIGHKFALELGTLLIEAGKKDLRSDVARSILIEAQDLAHRVKVTNLMEATR